MAPTIYPLRGYNNIDMQDLTSYTLPIKNLIKQDRKTTHEKR